MSARIRCHVLEVPAHDDWLCRRGGDVRELLPWADPYIAGLMKHLDNRYPRGERESCRFSELSDPYQVSAESDLPGVSDDHWEDDGWQEDAFMPQPLEAPRFHSYPPIYGGFPLLDDQD